MRTSLLHGPLTAVLCCAFVKIVKILPFFPFFLPQNAAYSTSKERLENGAMIVTVMLNANLVLKKKLILVKKVESIFIYTQNI